MAQIVLDIPDPQAPRVIDALCGTGGWQPSEPLTRSQFAKRELANMLKHHVRLYEAQQAASTVGPEPDIT